MGFSLAVVIRPHIDVLCFQFGVQNRLTGIQAGISRKHIADTAGQCEIQQTSLAEQFNCKEDGSNGTVGGSTKHRHQTQR